MIGMGCDAAPRGGGNGSEAMVEARRAAQGEQHSHNEEDGIQYSSNRTCRGAACDDGDVAHFDGSSCQPPTF